MYLKSVVPHMFWIFSFVLSSNAEYNFTEQMASSCKRYFSKSDAYESYMEVRGGHRDQELQLLIHLAVKGKSNFHILLSSQPSPPADAAVYEIVIGAGSNTFSEIRRMRKKRGISTVSTKNILSASKYTAMWLKAHTNGLLEVGLEGEELAFISYQDPSPLDIKYFSFSSWTGIELIILYDCPLQGETTADSVVVQRPLLPMERLRADLLKNYDIYSRPILNHNQLTQVYVRYEVKSVKYDVVKSELDTQGIVVMMWEDQKLSWDPKDYDNISNLTMENKQVWTPEIIIYDSIEMTRLGTSRTPLEVSFPGIVVHVVRAHTRTWCPPSRALTRWPRDTHVCSVRAGVWADHGQLRVTYLDMVNYNFTDMVDKEGYISSEWELMKTYVENQFTSYSPYAQGEEEREEEEDPGTAHNSINMTLWIARKSSTYTMLLYTPFIFSTFTTLMTFWIPSSFMTKMCVQCALLLFNTSCLMEVFKKMPTYMSHTPNIVVFYLWSTAGAWLSLVVSMVLYSISSRCRGMSYHLMCLLTSHVTTTALGLPQVKSCSSTYDSLGIEGYSMDSDPVKNSSAPSSDAQEEGEEKTDPLLQQYWQLLVTACDRVMFILYLGVYLTIFFLHY